ncbi:BRCA2-interacting transcriptional repressor EMSY-like [Centroberyx affinis]|uniref:BRCA2-interacting transcriptional repressor EMSY-like n=1 Tax=Centroberyx affinis TaxID=166261 RepID=UPI003A5C1A6E
MTPVQPMLAEACKSIEYAMKKCPNGMYSEIKYDGERVQVHKNGDSFSYFSRSLKPVLPHKVAHFKEYIPQAFPGGHSMILDAEVLLIDTKTSKPLPFGTLGVHKVIIVTTSPSSNFVPNILSKSHSHNNAAVSKLGSASMLTSSSQKQTVVFPAGSGPASNPTVAVTTVVSSTPSVVMSTVASCGSSAGVKVASARLPSPKTLVGSPTQILAQFPKQQSPKQLQQGSPLVASSVSQSQTSTTPPGSKPTIQIKQESGVKIITQQVQPSKILPKPSSVGLSSSSSSPIMVVSSNGAIMTTKLVSQPTGTQATYTRPTVSPGIGARISASTGGATYVKTTSGSIITVVPKSLATLGGKIISSNIVSGTTTKITTIPMTSKPNVIVVQKTTGKGATIQGLPGKNVVTTLLNAGGEKSLQAVQGSKPAIITASRPITKMIVTQPKGLSSGSQATATKIIPTKIVYGQQGKTQVLIKPKPVFQAAVVSEQTRQLVTETLQQVSRSSDPGQGQTSGQDGPAKDESGGFTESGALSGEASHCRAQDSQPVVHVVTSREQDWAEQEVAVESSPTIIYQDVSGGESQSATSTIKALLELQQTGKAGRAGLPCEDEDGVLSSSQQQGKPYKTSSQVTLVAKPVPSSSAAPVSHLSQMILSAAAMPQFPHRDHPLTATARSKPQIGQPSSSSSSSAAFPSTPLSDEETPQATRAVSAPGTPTKPLLTPQLPKLQQAPTSHHRPIHTPMSGPPPLQAHHPVSTDKTASSQQPIITQSATVTKITFGSTHHSTPVFSSGEAAPKLIPESSSRPAGGKPSVSDILKISMMEAEIDPSTEPMVVDSSSDRGPLGKALFSELIFILAGWTLVGEPT